MLTIPGTAALSSFRIDKLLTKLQTVEPTIEAVSAHFIHFVEISTEFDDHQSQLLQQLLNYGSSTSEPIQQGTRLRIVPRVGTISPWSSKATEIAERCGLTGVRRLERGMDYVIRSQKELSSEIIDQLGNLIHDRMTEQVFDATTDRGLFAGHPPIPMKSIAVLEKGLVALEIANTELGLALSDDEIQYLYDSFIQIDRNPTDVELMMFAQANSEHCRHKIFNAGWTIDGLDQAQTLFKMIQHSAEKSPQGILSAYHDNAAVIEGSKTKSFQRSAKNGEYRYIEEQAHLLIKVETHNHPTAISPHPGAATGSGGEIRDEGATGRGSASKAGLMGFSVSHLKIPGFEQPWEMDNGKPERIATALDIMLQGPIGGAAFNNEFGRPNLAGYFRSFEQPSESAAENEYRGYHKPIMIAGGMGNIRPMLVNKQPIPAGSLIIILGGPAMLIGLGGGAASSQTSGESAVELDFASVQRENPEMQRRCQEVINHCNSLGDDSPIISIHDIGAGGLSNAVPEIIHDCQRGGKFQLRQVPNADKGMSPMQIWCNEAQERYVVAIKSESLPLFESFCQREHCLYAVIGVATKDEQLTLNDEWLGSQVVNLPMSVLFGKPPKMHRLVHHENKSLKALDFTDIRLTDAVNKVLSFPAVADKSFLIHIGDRSVTGLVVRDQMVGPWQVPVADVAVTASGFQAISGEAMAIGERTPLALINAPVSGRMAIGEALTNLAASRIESLDQVKLSANWMAASGQPGEDADLFDTVKAVAMELCPQLGVAIPVGKDSLSMKTVWQDAQGEKTMTSPISLIITAYAPVVDVSHTLTPQLRNQDSILLLIDLGCGHNRLGGSTLAQVYRQLGNEAPDVDNPELLKAFFNSIQTLNHDYKILSYHDRSDGGLFTTVAEMMFAGRQGIEMQLDELLSARHPAGANMPSSEAELMATLFNEELGAVIQIGANDYQQVWKVLKEAGLDQCTTRIGRVIDNPVLTIARQGKLIYSAKRSQLQQIWSELSYRMQALRDNPECARKQFEQIADDDDPGLHARLTFNWQQNTLPKPTDQPRPQVAILREQGVNGHIEMAAAFDRAGFIAVDVHMSDIIHGRMSLQGFTGLAACGGFSYGDVLGAGGGWAKSILFNQRARDEFSAFFQRPDTFALGICNGCQMMAGIKDIIPGAEHWPAFKRNISEQFEARVVMVKVMPSPSIFLTGMTDSMLPVVVAHGEGRAEFVADPVEAEIALTYVDHDGNITEQFPANPNGSPQGITGLTTRDGRFTIMMPHPERCFRTLQNSWHPDNWPEDGAWMTMFRNARNWVDGAR